MININLDSQVIKNIGLVVFDKDGTLIDLYTYWYHMVELRARKLCVFYQLPLQTHKNNLMYDMGVDVTKKRLRPEGPVGLLPREVVQKAAEDYLLKFNCRDVAHVCFQVFKEVDEESLSLLDKFIQPLAGAVDLLSQIKSKGGKIAIATTDKTERAELAIKFLKIEGLVDIVVGADKVEYSKPAPDMLQYIGKNLAVLPQYSVMVGDAQTDIEMGINANFMAAIAVCSGLAARDELCKLTPYVVSDVSRIRVE